MVNSDRQLKYLFIKEGYSFFVADHDEFHKFSIARIPFTNTEQDFGNKNSSIHELHKITRELKVTSFKFRFIPKARKIPHQQTNHVLCCDFSGCEKVYLPP